MRFGLTQQATSSRAEWAKRARNLMDNRNYGMAGKAFRQAQDQVGPSGGASCMYGRAPATKG